MLVFKRVPLFGGTPRDGTANQVVGGIPQMFGVRASEGTSQPGSPYAGSAHIASGGPVAAKLEAAACGFGAAPGLAVSRAPSW